MICAHCQHSSIQLVLGLPILPRFHGGDQRHEGGVRPQEEEGKMYMSVGQRGVCGGCSACRTGLVLAPKQLTGSRVIGNEQSHAGKHNSGG